MGFPLEGAEVVVVGAGGAARAVVARAARRGRRAADGRATGRRGKAEALVAELPHRVLSRVDADRARRPTTFRKALEDRPTSRSTRRPSA